MWSWLTGGGNGSRNRLGSIFSRPREFTLESMRHLHAQLLKFPELGDAEVVELLRVLSEFLIYSDQNHGEASHAAEAPSSAQHSPRDDAPADPLASRAGVFFDYFCEKNILGLFVQLGESKPSVAVQIQLLQTLSILVQNIATRTSLYYILSNNYVNKLLECPFATARDDDVRDWYVTLLKALSLRLNEETVQFFFDDARTAFPLYAQALKFRRCTETMVKVAVKTLTLNVYRVQDDRVRQFILTYQNMAYFRDCVEYANELALQIQGLLNVWSLERAQALTEKLEEAIDEYIDHCYYLQDILDVNLPELCYRVGDLIYKRHVRKFLAASVLPDCNPPLQRVSTRLALYLLTRLTGVFEHVPLVNAISFMLLSPDASERCPYSAVALGAGSRRKSSVRAIKSSVAKRVVATAATPNGTSTEPTPADATSAKRKPKKAKKKKPHVFQAHSSATCNSSLCYLQTRFGDGEWPAAEVEQFAPSPSTNCYRQCVLALLASSDELLASAALLLVLAVVNNEAVDHTLLRELDLLPFRHRRHKKPAAGARLSLTVAEASGDDDDEAQSASGDEQHLESSVVSSTSSSDLSVSSTSQVEDDDENRGVADVRDTDAAVHSEDTSGGAAAPSPLDAPPVGPGATGAAADAYVGQYPHWLMDVILTTLARNPDTRLLSTQLAARLLVDIVLDPHRSLGSNAAAAAPVHWLLPRHAAVLKEIHSVSSHQVMESMRGAMADVDLFIYVLEDEFADFERAAFPMALSFKSASPCEFLVPHVLDDSSDVKATLHLRTPSSEMEVCRKSMRVFLTLRKLRSLVDEHYVADNLGDFVAFRHPHTSLLATAQARHRAALYTSETLASSPRSPPAVSLDGMVFLRCIWREQRFLHAPAKLMMVLNPEALVFAERETPPTESSASSSDALAAPSASDDCAVMGFVRLFAPIHRTYCSVDSKDERVLHLSISSAVPVDNCRSYDKASRSSSARRSGSGSQRLGELKSWHVSVVFETKDDCRQAKAHVDLSRAEVRAFKLLQIEESLTTHVQITHSANAAVSPKTKARRLSLDFEERRLQQERAQGRMV